MANGILLFVLDLQTVAEAITEMCRHAALDLLVTYRWSILVHAGVCLIIVFDNHAFLFMSFSVDSVNK